MDIDSMMGRYDSRVAPGCAVGVGHANRTLLAKGYGMADLEHQIPITSRSVFHAASLSKQFTAMAALILASEGKLALDDALGRHLPGLSPPTALVTIRQALQHTGGLRDQWELLAAAGWRLGEDVVTDDDIMSLVRRQRELNFTPGSEYSYSNTGFTLVARVVEARSGMPFAAFTSARIFGPLAMRASSFGGNDTIVAHRAAGHEQKDDESWRLRSPHYTTTGATGLLTTVEDLLLWGRNFDTARLAVGNFRELTTSAVLADGEATEYGLGIGLDSLGSRPAFQHSGSDPGFSSYLLQVPGHQLTVAILCNAGSIPAGTLARRIARRVLGDENPRVAALPWQVETDSAKYGWYWNGQRQQFWSIEADSGRLLGAENGSLVQFRLRWVAADRYRVGDGPQELEFTRGAPESLVLRHGENPPSVMRYERLTSWTPSSALLRSFVGRYRSEELATEYTLEMLGDTLVLRRPRQRELLLRPTFRNGFVANGVLVRIQGEGGPGTLLLINRPRLRALRFQRVQ